MIAAVFSIDLKPSMPVLLLAGAALAFYIASRLGAAVLDRRGDNPAGAAAAHWLPMAAVTLALLKQYPHAAVSIIFASSVACLTLVPGVTLFAAPREVPSDQPLAHDRRAWSMLLPAALLALLAGFRGYFTTLHAALFIVQGVVTLMVWTSPSRSQHDQPTTRDPTKSNLLIAMLMGAFWIFLTLFGAAVATNSIRDISSRVPHLSTGVVGALMIAPALVLPMIGSGLSLAQQGRPQAIVATCVDCVLLNLCLLLPITILAWRFMSGPDSALPYPMAVWRIDAVVLIILGAALLLISTKQWSPGRVEGAIGVLAFVVYMIANAKLATK